MKTSELSNLALIVLNYNSYDMCVRCVDGLLAFGLGCHIILVDNASPDDSYARLKEYYSRDTYDLVDVIRTDHNGGYGAGNNAGIRFAIEQYGVDTIGIMNPDVVIPKPEVLSELMNVLHSDDSYAVIGGTIMGRDGACNLNYSGWNIPTLFGLVDFVFLHGHRYKRRIDWPEVADGVKRVDCVAGCFFLMKSACMSEIGFFDEDIFMYFEEISVGIRIRKAGYTAVLSTDAVYYHDHQEADDSKLSLLDKIGLTRSSYDSARVICRKYYSVFGLPLIWLAEMVNRIILASSWIVHKAIRK